MVLAALGLIASSAVADVKKKPVKLHDSSSANSGEYDRSGAVAGEPDTDSCGLGWQVTNKKTIAGSITRGTTNSVVPPSFGMTSGTLGCARHPWTKRETEGAVYAISNYDRLKIEMAEGHGEFLDGFARVIGCGDTQSFGRALQRNYRQLLDGGSASPVRMFMNVQQQIKGDATLAVNCSV